MTNMEFYRDEIEEIVNGDFTIAVLENGVPVECTSDAQCDECIFERSKCSEPKLVKWLMAEHTEKPKLTKREKHFVEFAETGFLARDEDGMLFWYPKKPVKGHCEWHEEILCYVSSRGFSTEDDKLLFPIIKWEDAEPWSVEELRKLEVEVEFR